MPAALSNSSVCYAIKPNQSAACIASAVPDPNTLVPTSHGNFAGTYPPIYYAAMSVFASTDITASVLVMRIVNAVLFVLITTALFYLLPPQRRFTLVWMWSITIVPLGMFLLASNNPSAWAILSGGSLWLALVGYFESHGRRKALLGALAALTAVMGAGARADAAVYAGIAIVLAIILTFQRTRRYLISAILPVLLAVMALVLYQLAGQSGVSSNGFGDNVHVTASSNLMLLAGNLLDLPSLWVGSLGTWALGWLDTQMPATVWAGTILVFGAVILATLVAMNRRKLWAMIVTLVALTGIPMWVLYQSHAAVGTQVQPRYLLPLLIMFAGIALLQVANGRHIRFTRVQALAVGAILTLANAVALFTNLRRYIAGMIPAKSTIDPGQQWWWHTPVPPTAVWAIGSVAFALAVVIALVEFSDRMPRLQPDADQTVGIPITR